MAEQSADDELRKKYGGVLPTQKQMLKGRLGEKKKYFDSADWAKDIQHQQPKETKADIPPTTAAAQPMATEDVSPEPPPSIR